MGVALPSSPPMRLRESPKTSLKSRSIVPCRLASKPIRFAGERRAEVIVQLFNVFNTVNLSGLGTNAVAATFGVASRASAGRQAEVAVRLVW